MHTCGDFVRALLKRSRLVCQFPSKSDQQGTMHRAPTGFHLTRQKLCLYRTKFEIKQKARMENIHTGFLHQIYKC